MLEFIRDFIAENGFAPTNEEVGDGLGVSPVTAHEHIRGLAAKGVIRTERNRARSIEIVEEARWPHLPLLGRIAAGLPIEAVTRNEGFDFESVFPSDRDCFVLEVKGQSMIEDHIQDGDLVIVESRNHARPGETVVALVGEDEAT
ncbi:MAG: transcriptional repressor LexA, partial [Planctomycetes bacterium]|nr:transcriptional repressor LexA [Planctomycetota bacterium]